MSKSRLAHLKLTDIRANPVALRGVQQDKLDFQQLADSIKREGILSPISVREKQDTDTGATYYELIDGAQRFVSAKLAGFEEIPAYILDKNDQEVMIAQIVGNAKRVETRPVDYSKQIQKLMLAQPTLTMGELSDMLHVSPSWLDKILQLSGLHETIKPLVNDGHISMANAFVLVKLPPEEQLHFVTDAQTKPANEFIGPVLERVKAIKTANRAGKDASESVFTPNPKLRKMPEIQDALNDPNVGTSVVQAYAQNVEDSGITDTKSAAVGFGLGLQWAVRMDAQSLEKAKSDFEAQKKAIEDEKVRKQAERAEKQKKEAQERADKAAKEAEAAQAKAATVGV